MHVTFFIAGTSHSAAVVHGVTLAGFAALREISFDPELVNNLICYLRDDESGANLEVWRLPVHLLDQARQVLAQDPPEHR